MSQKEQAKAEKPKKAEASKEAKAPPKAAEASKEAKAPPKAAEAPGKSPRKAGESIVFIGRKPVMNYVVACLTSFNTGAEEVCIKARGRSMSRAVDTVELLRRSFLKGLGVKQINIGTEVMTREGRASNVSTIEITVAKAESK